MKRLTILMLVIVIPLAVYSKIASFDDLIKRNVSVKLYYQGLLLYTTTGIIWDSNTVLTNEHLFIKLEDMGIDKKDVQIFGTFVGLQKFEDRQEIPLQIAKESPSPNDNPMQDLLKLTMDKPDFFQEDFRPPKLRVVTETILRKRKLSKNLYLVYIVGNPGIGGVVTYNVSVQAGISKIINSNEEWGEGTIKDMTFIILDYTVIPGFSGSGVWNKKGELVGLVNMCFPLSNGQVSFSGVISAETIQKFMK